MAKKQAKKGVAGKGTGGGARKAIRAAQGRGCTVNSIASSTRRDASTISKIASGAIRNPPKNLASAVRKCKALLCLLLCHD